ncbi:helix-turn-helix domain-containing protein [Bradyrhizobium liaoningense]|uniref:helix-turn-helix domain-containing protein n=1 Tax=Bradyrhizobium liaoningense TaxID=43992 RepID=UPI003D9B88E7
MMKQATKAAKQQPSTRGVGDIDAEIGQRIRLIRIERNLSQQGLGEVLGVSFQQVQKYEKGKNRVSAARLSEIASKLGSSPHHLMGWQDPKTNVMTIDQDAYRLAREFQVMDEGHRKAVRALINSLISTQL